MLIDGKIYLGDEDGDVLIMQEGKTEKESRKLIWEALSIRLRSRLMECSS